MERASEVSDACWANLPISPYISLHLPIPPQASDVCWENLRYQTWWGGWYPIAMQCATHLLSPEPEPEP